VNIDCIAPSICFIGMIYCVAVIVHVVRARARAIQLIFDPWKQLMIDNCGTFTDERRLMQRAYKTASKRYHRDVFSPFPSRWRRAATYDYVSEARAYHIARNARISVIPPLKSKFRLEARWFS
jgi:preprotein translocase subunit Sec63